MGFKLSNEAIYCLMMVFGVAVITALGIWVTVTEPESFVDGHEDNVKVRIDGIEDECTAHAGSSCGMTFYLCRTGNQYFCVKDIKVVNGVYIK